VNMLLASRHPMFLWWGPELIQFYNDGYRPSIREDKHPAAVGQRGAECWQEIWPIIGPQIDAVMSRGESTRNINQLVPINRKYPITELMAACRAYPGLSNARRITFEYVMLKGLNDSLADAKALIKLLAGIPAKINLIPFNPWPGAPHEGSDWEQIERFAEVVNRAGYASPVRTPRGRDIMAACGQLKSESLQLSARERRDLEGARKRGDSA